MVTISYDELFTPNDIKAFYRLAAPNLRSGCWGSVRRRCSSACDCLDWRGIATRYDKLALTYRAAAVLAAICAWKRHLRDTP